MINLFIYNFMKQQIQDETRKKRKKRNWKKKKLHDWRTCIHPRFRLIKYFCLVNKWLGQHKETHSRPRRKFVIKCMTCSRATLPFLTKLLFLMYFKMFYFFIFLFYFFFVLRQMLINLSVCTPAANNLCESNDRSQ